MSEEQVVDQPIQESPKLDELVKAYLTIRNASDNLYRQYMLKKEELESEMKQLEHFMLDECNELKVESLRTNNGTITKTVKEQYNCSNWDEFKQYIIEHNALELLQQRIHNGNFKEYMQGKEAEGLPPGISSVREYSIIVRKPTSR
jgi:mannose-6-phosphate isomerase class I